MTEEIIYDCAMSLLSIQSQGFLWTSFLLILCVILVHGIKLAIIGYRTLGKKQTQDPPPKEQEKAPEPVFYLVERKKKRSKTEYSDPKQISFR